MTATESENLHGPFNPATVLRYCSGRLIFHALMQIYEPKYEYFVSCCYSIEINLNSLVSDAVIFSFKFSLSCSHNIYHYYENAQQLNFFVSLSHLILDVNMMLLSIN